MLIKFLPTNKGNIKRLIDYLTKEYDLKGAVRDPLPEILAGDPQQLILITQTLRFKQKYQTGVISFAPGDDPTEDQQAEVMSYFERTAFPGLDRDQYDILWVRHSHTRENRTELHFVLPCVELNSRKSLTVTDPKSHLYYYTALRDYFNFKYGWADPSDPARRRNLQPDFHAYIHSHNERVSNFSLKMKTRDDIKRKIHEFIEQQIEDGIIYDRYTMKIVLELQGFTLNREGKDYISIKRDDFSKPIRFKGKIYERGWRADSEIDRRIQDQGDSKQGVTGEDYQRRVRELQEDLERRISNRAKRFSQRYAKAKWDEYYSSLVERHLDDHQSIDGISQPQSININTAEQSTTNQQVGEKDDGLGKGIAEITRPIQQGISAGKATATATNEGVAEFFRRINEGTEEINRGEERNYRSLDRIDTGVAEQGRRIGLALQNDRREIYTAHENVSRLDEAVTRITKQIIKDKEELDDFNKWVNFVDYATTQGYAVHLKESTPNGFAMKNKRTGDRIFVGRENFIYFYVSLSDPADRGMIADFIKKRSGKNLKQIREELRPWLQGKVGIKAERDKSLPELNTTSKDKFLKELKRLEAMCAIIPQPANKLEVVRPPQVELEPAPVPGLDDYLEPEAPNFDDGPEL